MHLAGQRTALAEEQQRQWRRNQLGPGAVARTIVRVFAGGMHFATKTLHSCPAVARRTRFGRGHSGSRSATTMGFGRGGHDRVGHHTRTPGRGGVTVGLYRIAAADQRRDSAPPERRRRADPLCRTGDGGTVVARRRPHLQPRSAERQLRQATQHDCQFDEQFKWMELDSRRHQHSCRGVSRRPAYA